MTKRPNSSSLRRPAKSRPGEYHSLSEHETAASKRLTLDLNAETIDNLDTLKRALGDETNTEVIRQALRLRREMLDSEVAEKASREIDRKKGPKPSVAALNGNRREIMRYAGSLITALQEALDYDPLRNHNQQPPPLYSDDPNYLKHIAELTSELKRLNSLLESTTKGQARKKSADATADYLSLFLKNFIPAAAKSSGHAIGPGAAALAVGLTYALLSAMGVHLPAVSVK
jgi:hypothetical protein